MWDVTVKRNAGRMVNSIKRAEQGWEKNGFGCAGSRKVMSLMNLKSGQRGHVMPGGDRPFSMLLTLCLPQNPAGRKAWPLANWCILCETQCKDRLGSNIYL